MASANALKMRPGVGAQEGIRTSTPLRALDPESNFGLPHEDAKVANVYAAFGQWCRARTRRPLRLMAEATATRTATAKELWSREASFARPHL